MFTVAFDTLKLARKLESAGFPAKQAQDASAALAESFAEWQSVINLATREDVMQAKIDLEAKVAGAGAGLEKKISDVNVGLEKKMFSVENKVSDVDKKISESKAEILKWMFGSVAVQTLAIIGALISMMHGAGR